MSVPAPQKRVFAPVLSRQRPGSYKVTLGAPITRVEAGRVVDALRSTPHVKDVTAARSLVHITLDSENNWPELAESVNGVILGALEPNKPHTEKELHAFVDALREKYESQPHQCPTEQRWYTRGGAGRSDPQSPMPPGTDSFVKEACEQIIESAINPVLARDKGSCAFSALVPAPSTAIGLPQYELRLEMHGACKGCPASTVTMKAFIEKTVREYLPEVSRVEEAGDAQAGE